MVPLDEGRNFYLAQANCNLELSLSVTKAIFALPSGYRQIFQLHEQVGLSHVEIGELLEISAATSRSQLCRARLALREMLMDHPIEDRS